MKIRFLIVGAVVGFLIATACGAPASTCDVSNCATGCCSAAGECLGGDSAPACGTSARQCVACTASQVCTAHACVAGPIVKTDGGQSNDGGPIATEIATAVLNEISARGTEFIELYVTRAGDLGGLQVTDSQDDGGLKLSDAFSFPSGTVVAAGSFVTVLTGQNDAGPSTACAGHSTPCFAATFGVSNSRGETVWLLNAANVVVDSEAYPANGAPSGSSIGRLPDGMGSWLVSLATPGAPNGPPDAGAAVDSGSPTDAGTARLDAGAAADAGTLALNEISARGAGFIELYVTAGGELGGYALADTDTDGGPKLSEALRFSAGTVAPTGTFITVVTNASASGASTDCPNGANPCFGATFSISNSRGETVWLLDANDAVIDSHYYPPNGADGGASIGRVPDGVGAWQVITPFTPGAPN